MAFAISLSLAPSAQALATPRAGAPAAPLSQEEVRQAAQIKAGLELLLLEESSVWPNYRPDAFPIVFHKPGRFALLFNGDTRLPDSFKALREVSGVAVSMSAKYNRGIDTAARIGDRSGVTIEFDGGIGTTFSTAVHEAFHHYQYQQQFFGRKQEGPSQIDASEDRALAEIEQRLLSDAIESTDPGAIRKGIARFLAVRQTREAKLPLSVREYQDQLEAREGTARYVEENVEICGDEASNDKRSAYRFFARSRASVLAALAKDLRRDLSPNAYARGRHYYTGAAMAYLLNQLSPDWQEQVEHGARLSQLLAAASGFESGQREAIYREVVDWHGLEASVNRIEAFAAEEREARAALVRDFQQAKGMRVTLLMPSTLGFSFNAEKTPLTLSETQSLYQPGTTISNEIPQSSLSISGMVLEDNSGEKTALTFYVPIDTLDLRVDGQSKKLKPGHYKGALDLKGENVRFTHSKATIRLSGSELSIEI